MHSAAVVAAARAISYRGLAPGTSGNVSVRSDSGILITPTRVRLDAISESDLAEVGFDGRVTARGRQPSREVALHLAVYQVRPDVNAIVHTHSPYATACGVAQERLVETEDWRYYGIDDVVWVPLRPAGSRALADACVGPATTADVLMLERHGVVCLGRNASIAALRAEAVEHIAQVTWLVRSLAASRALGPRP